MKLFPQNMFPAAATFSGLTAVLCLIAGALCAAPPEELMRERKPERRAVKAVELAERKMKEAGTANRAGERTEMLRLLREIPELLQFCQNTLQQTGKPPRKLTSQYKRAEQGSNRILRLLNDLVEAQFVEDRPPVEEIRDEVRRLHEEFLSAVMYRR